MIKYIVIKYGHNHTDEWTEILANDISDIENAESLRSHYLQKYPSVDPLNVHVVQVRE